MSHVCGPLYSSTDTCAPLSPLLKDFMTDCAADFAASNPAWPMLELASMSITTSSLELQWRSPVASFGLHGSALQRRNCWRKCDSSLGQDPSPRGASAMPRSLISNPPSHALEHVDHSDHVDKLQSASHASLLHATVSVSWSHGAPPCLGCVRIPRVRVRTPPLHCPLQELHPLHSSSRQSTGHWRSPHARVISKGGHAAPFFAGATTTRFKICTPPLQVALHSAAVHWDTSQS
mmetsp:Transcript_70201/g.195365  ORF Transcript_70201/g.195365 Transcript_70201/m.195365 type:complete len:234 (-) Transcript_70201:963-1664(-)